MADNSIYLNQVCPMPGGLMMPVPLPGSYDYHYVIMKLKGLRQDVTAEQVLNIFKYARRNFALGVSAPSGIFLPTRFQHGTGEAFVIFPSIRPSFPDFFNFVDKWVTRYGACYEVSSTRDLLNAMFPWDMQVPYLHNASGTDRSYNASMAPPEAAAGQPSRGQSVVHHVPGASSSNITQQQPAAQPPIVVDIPRVIPNAAPQFTTYLSTLRNCVILRGIPFKARLSDICCFLHEFICAFNVEDVIIFVNTTGFFNGIAFVEMFSEGIAAVAVTRLHRGIMTCAEKTRYIEVYQGTRYEAMAVGMLPDCRPVTAITYVPPTEMCTVSEENGTAMSNEG